MSALVTGSVARNIKLVLINDLKSWHDVKVFCPDALVPLRKQWVLNRGLLHVCGRVVVGVEGLSFAVEIII